MENNLITPDLLQFAREELPAEPYPEGLPISKELLEDLEVWRKVAAARSKAGQDAGRAEPSSLAAEVFDFSAIDTEPEDSEIRIRGSQGPARPWRRIGVAAAILLAAGLLGRYVWRSAGRDSVLLTKKPPKIESADQTVRDGAGNKDGVRSTPKTFEAALASLQERHRSGANKEELRRAYDSLAQEFPGHEAQIKLQLEEISNPPKLVEKLDSPPHVVGPPPSEGERVRDALIKQISGYAEGRPLPVRQVEVRSLRELVQDYLEKNPGSSVPAFDSFIAASEINARNEVLYAEARAREIDGAMDDSPEVVDLRNFILELRLRDETRPIVLSKKSLDEFTKAKPPRSAATKEAGMRIAASTILGRRDPADKRKPYLLCVLPPGIREEAIGLYGDIQALAKEPDRSLDGSLLEYLTLARRPAVEDTLGMIIPMYIYPDKDNPAPWNEVLALGNRGIRIKVIIGPNFENVTESDPAYLNIIDALHERRIEVLGVVGCKGGVAGIEKARREISIWHSLYRDKLDGLFFADQSPGEGLVGPYRELYRSARDLERQWEMISGIGAPCNEAFLTETGADILFTSISPGGPHTKGWEGKYDPSRFAAIVFGVTDPTLVPNFLGTSVEKHIGWIFIDGKDSNIRKPPFLEGELSSIQQINKAILGGNLPNTPRLSRPAPAKKKGTRKSP